MEEKDLDTPLTYEDVVEAFRTYQNAFGILSSGAIDLHIEMLKLLESDHDKFLPILEPLQKFNSAVGESMTLIQKSVNQISAAAVEREASKDESSNN